MSDIRYLKSVRTRYRTILQREVDLCERLVQSDTYETIDEELLAKVNKSIKTLEVYREKLEIQSKDLCRAISDTDEDFLCEVLEQDGELAEKATECCINLEEFKEQYSCSRE